MEASSDMGIFPSIISLVVFVFMIVAMWKIFEKAGEAGWKSIIPILHLYVLFKIAFGNGWIFLLLLVPFVNLVVMFIMYWKLAKAFGGGIGMCILTMLLPTIGTLILGFGSAEYQGA